MVPLASRGYQFNSKEVKFFDYFINGQAVTSTGVVAAFFTPVQGTDIYNRIGRKVVAKSIFLRAYLISSPALTLPTQALTGQMCRMMILIDFQPNASIATPTNILEQVYCWSPLNYDNRDRFKVLCDKSFVMDPYIFNPGATLSQNNVSGQVKQWKRFRRIRQEVIFNNGNAGSYADVSSGLLLVFFMCTNNAPSGYTVYYNIRTRFLDD